MTAVRCTLLACLLAACGPSSLFAVGKPYLVKDINPEGGSAPMELTKVGNRLFFSANDGVHGRELWVTDGTSVGTYMVVDLRPGLDWSDPVALTEAGGRIFFQARNADGGLDLYVSDGTLGGTIFLINLTDGAFYHQMDSLNGMLFFQRGVPPNDQRQLWRTDGTQFGTSFVKNVRVNHMGRVGEFMYFAGVGEQAVVPGFDLWKTDGTTNGTQMLADLEGCLWIADFNGHAIFRGDFSPEGREPWISDGTPQGTHLLKDINPGSMWSDPAGFTLVNDVMLFSAYEGTDLKLWRTDGTEQGTYSIIDGGAGDITPFKDMAILRRFQPDIGIELWKTDGTAEGTMLIKDIRPGPENSTPDEFELAGDRFYFKADDGVHGRELWVTDGTEEGTTLVSDLYVGSGSSVGAGRIVNVDGIVFWSGGNPTIGGELWALNTQPAQIPAVSIWGLFCFALLLGTAGSITVLKRKDCVA